MTRRFESDSGAVASPSDAVIASEPSTRSRGARLGRNTAINFAGAVLPLAVSLATVPAYLHLIGTARYGVLAIIWIVLGYFGVFDLGLSRATANQIARMRDDPPEARETVFWTALVINATLGAAGGAALYALGNFLLDDVLRAPSDLRSEAVAALPWLALAVPLTTVGLVMAGTLEGRELFLRANLLTSIGIMLFQLIPLGYAELYGPELDGVIMAAALALLVGTALSFAVTVLSLPARRRPAIDFARAGALFKYGGWITISGLVSPVLVVMDRIVIGAVLGARSVALYTIPYALENRVQLLASSLSRTLFPRFSMLSRRDAAAVGRDAVASLAAVMTPVVVTGIVLLEPFLRLWVGEKIALDSAPIGEILFIGIWINSLAFVPYAFLQAQGRPDLTAKFHLLEAPPYIAALFLGLHVGGLHGAAWAWTARAAADAALLFWGATAIPSSDSLMRRRDLVNGSILVSSACVASLAAFANPVIRAIVGSLLIAISIWWAWQTAPSAVRAALRNRLAQVLPIR